MDRAACPRFPGCLCACERGQPPAAEVPVKGVSQFLGRVRVAVAEVGPVPRVDVKRAGELAHAGTEKTSAQRRRVTSRDNAASQIQSA